MSDKPEDLRRCENCDIETHCDESCIGGFCMGWRRSQKLTEAPRPQDSSGSAGFTLLTDNCACCGKEISADHVSLGCGEYSICMGCEGVEIDVWKVECNGSWYADKNFANVAEMLKDIEHDEPYTISKLKMRFAKYISLPEFQGF